MSGLLGSLNTAASGMRANQTVIQTINHNISNMNTPGYTRQRVELQTNIPYTRPGVSTSPIGAGQIGQGVSAASITRVRNSFYDYQLRSETHNYGNVSIKAEHFSNIESIFNEPSDTSISSALNNFFNGFTEIAKNPTSTYAKKHLVESTTYLTNTINQVTQRLDTLKDNLKVQEEGTITDINNILGQLADLEKDIKLAEAVGKNPNDLLDRKDLLIDELSFKVNINDADVQAALADGTLTADEVAAINTSGELQAIKDMQDEIDSIIGEMEVFMKTLADGVNDIYRNDPTAPDTKDFFVLGTDKNGLPTISINDDILNDPTSLVMSSDKALALADVKTTKFTVNGESVTIGGFFNNIIQEVGYRTQEMTRETQNRAALIFNIEDAKASISGVSLDEEMISLMQFEHAYNATAKVAATIDSLLDVVINGLIK